MYVCMYIMKGSVIDRSSLPPIYMTVFAPLLKSANSFFKFVLESMPFVKVGRISVFIPLCLRHSFPSRSHVLKRELKCFTVHLLT